MDNLSQSFEERLQEIEAYLDLLEELESQVRDGLPQFGRNGAIITVQQQRILYSSVYLQLYNLIESTITKCLEAVTQSVILNQIFPGQLSEPLRKEWIRSSAQTHIDLNYENRLKQVLKLCDELVQIIPVSEFKFEKGPGGSWDDKLIKKTVERLGFTLKISSDVYRDINRPFRDGEGPLQVIKKLRNDLAHGSLSFAECGEGMTVSDLRDLTKKSSSYLREVVMCFKISIEEYEFLMPEHRPEGGNNG
jgi:hypothetical protein